MDAQNAPTATWKTAQTAVSHRTQNLAEPRGTEPCGTQRNPVEPGRTLQYLRFCCRTRSNFAVSATAMTAMTPAWTGSLTTRSAASGTLPGHVQRDHIQALLPDVLDRLRDLPSHQRSRQHEQPHARQADDRADGGGQLHLADERDRVDRDPLTADVVTVCLRDGPHRHLTDLCPASHHDDPLAVDFRERRGLLEPDHARHLPQVPDHVVGRTVAERELEVDVGVQVGAVHVHVRDVRLMVGEHTSEAEEHAGLIGDGDEDGVDVHAAEL